MKTCLQITILALCVAYSLPVQAQTPSSLDGVEIYAEPANPSPGQNIVASVESYATDLNSAAIVWIVNGKAHAQGTGLVSVSVTAPALGKSTQVVVIIKTVENREVRKSITIKSGSVDIIWESSGYTPPFYRGKALFAYENPIKIIAVPHLAEGNGVEIDPRTLVYKWKKNDKVVQDQSGYGKQILNLQEEIPRPIDIEVEVATKNGSQKGVASIRLEPGNPSISFYEDSPLYGVMYNKAIVDKVRLENQEITIRAVPYTFNQPLLTYLWSINNLERQDLSTNQSITLRTKGDTGGSSSISLEIRNPNDILQSASNAVSVFFNKNMESDTKF